MNRSDYIAMASSTCEHCHGTAESKPGVLCNCVYRAIFRACWVRYLECRADGILRPISLDGTSAPKGRYTGWGRMRIEYQADFLLVSKRTLDAAHHGLFELHVLCGADWKTCCQELGLRDKGTVFHAVYRIQHQLGRAFLDLRPFPLYPLPAYFSRSGQAVKPCPMPAPRYSNGIPLRPPLAPRAARPAPVIVMPDRAPVVPTAPAVDVQDPEAVAQYVRKRFRANLTMRAIALDLNKLGAPVPDGSAQWLQRHVRRVLLNGPMKRAA
jgi:hypothetical protein